MPSSKIIVVGASNGGIEALCRLLAGLPKDFRTPVLLVQHVGRTDSILPSILSRCGPLKVVHPTHRELIESGCVYVAPSNQHLIVSNSHMTLSHGPRENRARPAVDPLFRSAARFYRENAIGVLLTGELDDGVAGLAAIKARGGIAIVQEPTEAPAPSMPRSALKNVEVDHVSPVAKIPSLLVELSEEKSMAATKRKKKAGKTTRHPSPDNDNEAEDRGTQVPIACPDCSGPIYEIKNGKMIKFKCIVGHSYSPVALNDAQCDALERAIWMAICRLKERLVLQRSLAEKHMNRQEKDLAERMAEDAKSIQRDIDLLLEIQGRI